jgi:hypothetical protein
MEKLFRTAELRDLEQQVTKGEISYSRMVEILNEKHFIKLVELRQELSSPSVNKVSKEQTKYEFEKSKLTKALDELESLRARLINYEINELGDRDRIIEQLQSEIEQLKSAPKQYSNAVEFAEFLKEANYHKSPKNKWYLDKENPNWIMKEYTTQELYDLFTKGK